jgi:predicted RNase H-like HicB family nuclease
MSAKAPAYQARLDHLEHEVRSLRELCEKVRTDRSIIVPIETLASEDFALLRPFQIVVQPVEAGYLATFFDAGVSTGGDTQEEAVANLKDLLIDLFEAHEQDEAILGPVPAKQLAVLRTILQRAK